MVPAIVAITVAIFLLVNFSVSWVVELARSRRRRLALRRAFRLSVEAPAPTEIPSLKRFEPDDARASVLVVGGVRANREALWEHIALAGYRTDSVHSAREARELMSGTSYEIVLRDEALDLGEPLPHPDGASPDLVTIRAATGSADSSASLAWPAPHRVMLRQLRQLLTEREQRLAARPTVQIVTAERRQSTAKHVINVPAGLFVAPNHTWVRLEPNGEVRVGLDEFALKLLSSTVDDVDLPLPNDQAGTSTPLFSLRHGARSLPIMSPIEGQVTGVNDVLYQDPELLAESPYTKGWICTVRPKHLATQLAALRLGEEALDWYTEEIERHLGGRGGQKAARRRHGGS